MKHNITVFRRLRKTDNLRLGRACGATIVNRPEEIRDSDVGTGCGLFEVRKLGDEYFAFFEECANPGACSIILRGAGKDVLNEVERNLQDAMCVTRNIVLDPRLCPGGGATEMALAVALQEKSKSIEGVAQYPYRAAGQALEVIARTLAQNCGANVVRVITQLRVCDFLCQIYLYSYLFISSFRSVYWLSIYLYLSCCVLYSHQLRRPSTPSQATPLGALTVTRALLLICASMESGNPMPSKRRPSRQPLKQQACCCALMIL